MAAMRPHADRLAAEAFAAALHETKSCGGTPSRPQTLGPALANAGAPGDSTTHRVHMTGIAANETSTSPTTGMPACAMGSLWERCCKLVWN